MYSLFKLLLMIVVAMVLGVVSYRYYIEKNTTSTDTEIVEPVGEGNAKYDLGQRGTSEPYSPSNSRPYSGDSYSTRQQNDNTAPPEDESLSEMPVEDQPVAAPDAPSPIIPEPEPQPEVAVAEEPPAEPARPINTAEIARIEEKIAEMKKTIASENARHRELLRPLPHTPIFDLEGSQQKRNEQLRAQQKRLDELDASAKKQRELNLQLHELYRELKRMKNPR